MTNVDISTPSSGREPLGAGLSSEPMHPFAADDRVEVKSIADLVGHVHEVVGRAAPDEPRISHHT
jgi:hypothetical protein